MKTSELIEKLQAFNPDAEVVVNIQGERLTITGIWSWAAHPGESAGPRDIAKEKALTTQVTLATETSCSAEDLE